MESQYSLGPMQIHDAATFDEAAPILRLATDLGLEAVLAPYADRSGVVVQIPEPGKAFDGEGLLALVLAVEQLTNPGAVEAILERARDTAGRLSDNARR